MNKDYFDEKKTARDVQKDFQENFKRGYEDWMNEHVDDAYELGRKCAQRDYFERVMRKTDECIKFDFSRVTCGRSVL